MWELIRLFVASQLKEVCSVWSLCCTKLVISILVLKNMLLFFQKSSQRIPSRLRQAWRPTFITHEPGGRGWSPRGASVWSPYAGTPILIKQPSTTWYYRPASGFAAQPNYAQHRAPVMPPGQKPQPLSDPWYQRPHGLRRHRQLFKENPASGFLQMTETVSPTIRGHVVRYKTKRKLLPTPDDTDDWFSPT